jgi:hypothetical protein
MSQIPGGAFWAGSGAPHGPPDELPRYQTRVSPFCLDRTEVTVQAYLECVAQGKCSPAHGEQKTCNAHRGDRPNHPINCVDWRQADVFCRSVGKRLPTELEWEYAARGGDEQRAYSWGNDEPDLQTCWKSNHSCEVGRFPAGAFGLSDMTGNVWEWTGTWYGAYPWPPETGDHRVYRGGGWSRRFPKWMKATLRNRANPKEWGSHLGFRCASQLAHEGCAYGLPRDGRCPHGVDGIQCQVETEAFNGVRCAAPGAPPCSAGHEEIAGYGCVGGAAALKAASAERSGREASAGEVARIRSPEFDADCRQFQASRPQAFRFSGGTHDERNRLGRSLGCKNRDVGVGWNSACCP